VPGHVRPSFQAVEEACRGAKDEARAAVADPGAEAGAGGADAAAAAAAE